MTASTRHEECAGFSASPWYTSTASESFPSLTGELSTEVVVIGAGYTGLSTALQLARRNIDVVVLEAQVPGWGASGRNNGGVVPDFAFSSVEKIVQNHGQAWGRKLCRLVDESANRLRELVAGLDDDCDLVLNGFADLAHSRERVAFLRARFESLSERGHQVRWLGEEESAHVAGSPFYGHGGYLLEGAGHVNPLKLAQALARAVKASGGRIFAHSAATTIAAAQGGWRVTTAAGAVLARQVVIAQNAYAGQLWPGLHKGTIRIQPWLVATKPLSEEISSTVIPHDYLIGDSHPLPYFFRKDREGRLSASVVRGLDVFGGKPDPKAMAAVLKEIFPQIGEVEFECLWQGTATLQPGELPRIVSLANGVWAAFGFGRGVTMTHVVGAALADLCAGMTPEEAGYPVTAFEKIKLAGLIEKLLPAVLLLLNRRG
ncbi:MAG: FAD-dependent oxidoreductase [Porticoccaceae bacterium]